MSSFSLAPASIAVPATAAGDSFIFSIECSTPRSSINPSGVTIYMWYRSATPGGVNVEVYPAVGVGGTSLLVAEELPITGEFRVADLTGLAASAFTLDLPPGYPSTPGLGPSGLYGILVRVKNVSAGVLPAGSLQVAVAVTESDASVGDVDVSLAS